LTLIETAAEVIHFNESINGKRLLFCFQWAVIISLVFTTSRVHKTKLKYINLIKRRASRRTFWLLGSQFMLVQSTSCQERKAANSEKNLDQSQMTVIRICWNFFFWLFGYLFIRSTFGNTDSAVAKKASGQLAATVINDNKFLAAREVV